MPLLSIENLTVQYGIEKGVVTATDSVNLNLGENEFVAVVGESGCGKTTLGLSIMRLLPKSVRIPEGAIRYKGVDLLKLGRNQIRNYRGAEIAMIFQEPLTSLNPVFRVEDQLAEAIVLKQIRKSGQHAIGEVMQKAYDIRNHPSPSRLPRLKRSLPHEIKKEAEDWLKQVRIADPEQVLRRYPFELSGGMRQRIMIAMALSQEPSMLIADEPTTALDVTTQAQILKLVRNLMDEFHTSVFFVTHDLAVASQVADRVVVMYAGEVVEDAEVHDLFSKPLHPYTKGLLKCIPTETRFVSSLSPIPGSIPDMMHPPTNCRYAPRCPYTFGKCISNHPKLQPVDLTKVACFLYEK